MQYLIYLYTNTHIHIHIYVHGRDGNLPQCSYLRNPKDREAWWAIVHQSQRIRHNLLA